MFCFVFRGDWFEEVSVGVEWGDSSIGERNEPNWVSSVLSWWVCFGISVTICVFFLLRLFFAFIFWWLQLVSCHCVCMCGVSIWVFFYCFCFCYALVDVYYYYYYLNKGYTLTIGFGWQCKTVKGIKLYSYYYYCCSFSCFFLGNVAWNCHQMQN